MIQSIACAKTPNTAEKAEKTIALILNPLRPSVLNKSASPIVTKTADIKNNTPYNKGTKLIADLVVSAVLEAILSIPSENYEIAFVQTLF